MPHDKDLGKALDELEKGAPKKVATQTGALSAASRTELQKSLASEPPLESDDAMGRELIRLLTGYAPNAGAIPAKAIALLRRLAGGA